MNMDLTSYCDNLENHLAGWKMKVRDVIGAVNRLPDNETAAISPTIQGLQGMMDEINNELEQLRSACPADWSPSRNVIDDKMSELHATLKMLSEKVGGPLIPDSLLWVSE